MNQEAIAKLQSENAALRALVQQYANASAFAQKLLTKGSYAQECLEDCNKDADMGFNIQPKR